MKRLLAVLFLVYFVGCGEETKPGLEPCLACGELVSISADVCVHCGHKSPSRTMRLVRLEARELELKARAAEIDAERARVVVGWGNQSEHVEMDNEYDDITNELADIAATKKDLE